MKYLVTIILLKTGKKVKYNGRKDMVQNIASDRIELPPSKKEIGRIMVLWVDDVKGEGHEEITGYY